MDSCDAQHYEQQHISEMKMKNPASKGPIVSVTSKNLISIHMALKHPPMGGPLSIDSVKKKSVGLQRP